MSKLDHLYSKFKPWAKAVELSEKGFVELKLFSDGSGQIIHTTYLPSEGDLLKINREVLCSFNTLSAGMGWLEGRDNGRQSGST